jgi:hypothetical protein
VSEPGRPLVFENVTDGFLTEEGFAALYDSCGGILHARNPFRTDSRKDKFCDQVPAWLGQIDTLLRVHYLQFAENADIWVVVMHDASDGRVHARAAEPKAAT